MVRAFRTVVGFLGVLIFSACSESGGDSALLKAETEKLREEAEKLSSAALKLESLNRESANLIRNIEREQRKETQMRLEFEEIEDYANSLRAADTYIAGRMAAWRTAASQYLVGSEIGDVRLNSGNILRSAVVVELGKEVVKVSHSEGELTLGYEEFPEAVRLRLFHEPTIILTTKLAEP